ncbi:MAG TPA: homoserine O-acetyltransferase [Caldithrix abyssi]|uniref:Homoserine O-acetyltransferase n=1 Tax=Caldithrix abyssi TaxID=187145 RepID=A0A7V1LML6_CALAY|nr:homoserine O-acetyltransferase [Caldithrix abyssi]
MIKSKTKLKELYSEQAPLYLEKGGRLPRVRVAYETYGRLNAAGDNALLVCHALTGDAHAAGQTSVDNTLLRQIPLYAAKKKEQPGWWDGLIGPGKALDTERYFVICSNVLGSCYGTSGPASVDGDGGREWKGGFPEVTVRDMVKVQKKLLDELGVHRLQTVIGGSLGGMQALEWAVSYPRQVRSVIPIATAARHSAWAIGFSHLMRQAIKNDPGWREGAYTVPPARGLSLARQIGMISYRTDISFQRRFAYKKNAEKGQFEVESYLSYQGDKLVERFDANSFILLTEAMDSHDLGRDRGGVEQALASVKASALCVGIDSDLLYPAHEQREIAGGIPGARYHEIRSRHGHDAFLIEYDQLEKIIKPFLNGL